jgi:hypothetical protein
LVNISANLILLQPAYDLTSLSPPGTLIDLQPTNISKSPNHPNVPTEQVEFECALESASVSVESMKTDSEIFSSYKLSPQLSQNYTGRSETPAAQHVEPADTTPDLPMLTQPGVVVEHITPAVFPSPSASPLQIAITYVEEKLPESSKTTHDTSCSSGQPSLGSPGLYLKLNEGARIVLLIQFAF